MKWQALIVLAAILLGVIVPQPMQIAVIRKGHMMIGSLDVCHSVATALSGNTHRPCVGTPAFIAAPDPVFVFGKVARFILAFPFFSDRNDRPPNA